MPFIAVPPVAISIQDVLSLLPELFPGVQEIPLKNIRFDPDNPGTPITDGQTQELADDMSARGQQNPIQVCPDKANPLAPGVALHPDNPRIKEDGTPWRLEDFNWVTLAGEGRSRAALKLQWVTIKGFIRNPTQEEAVKITYWDNRIRYRGDWWPDYQTIERLIKANPNLTQEQVGVSLKMDKPKVNRALQLLPLLNTEARRLIGSNATNTNKGIWGISERAAACLAALGPGSGLKPGVKAADDETQKLWPYPPIPAATQDLVWQALAVAIKYKMTEAKVAAFVAWIKQGHTPEEYNPKTVLPTLKKQGKSQTVQKADAETAEAMPRGKDDTQAAPHSPQDDGEIKTPLRHRVLNHLKSHLPKVRQSLRAAFVPSGQARQVVTGWWQGIKAYLIKQFKRALGNLIRRWITTGVVIILVILFLSPHLPISIYRLVAGYPSSHSRSPLRQILRAQAVQSQTVKPALPSGAQEARFSTATQQALAFATHFYGVNYQNPKDWIGAMQSQLDPKYSDAFFTVFFPTRKDVTIDDWKLVESFQATQPAKILGAGPAGEAVLVQGTARLVSDLKQPGKLLAEGPVTVEIHIKHFPIGNPQGMIVLLKEVPALQFDWNMPPPQINAKPKHHSKPAPLASAQPITYNSALATEGKAKAQTSILGNQLVNHATGESSVATKMATPTPAKKQGDDQLGKTIGNAVGTAVGRGFSL